MSVGTDKPPWHDLLSSEQINIVESRREICGVCPQQKKIDVVSVVCKACGCAGVSLISGRCKLRRWPVPGEGGTPMPKPESPPKPPEAWESIPAASHGSHRGEHNSLSSLEALPGSADPPRGRVSDLAGCADSPGGRVVQKTQKAKPGLFVYGFPGLYAGANTELHHQVILWRSMGLAVDIIPNDHGYRNEPLYDEMISRGVTIHEANDFDAITPGAPVLAFCNAKFLDEIDQILERSCNTVFVNCMTWLFEMEKRRHREGKIGTFLYQNDVVRSSCERELRQINACDDIAYMTFRPYFDSSSFPFVETRDPETFTIGRISRHDPDKFHADTLRIWESIESPVAKRGLMLGFSRDSRDKIGLPPNWIETFENQRELSQAEFYRQVDVIVQPMDTTENWPRIGLEAMASGSVLIVDHRGGWQNMVEHGKTGWLCESPDDFVRYATRMALEPETRRSIAAAARVRLEAIAGLNVSKASWQGVLQTLELQGRCLEAI